MAYHCYSDFDYFNNVAFEDLKGRTIKAIERSDDELKFAMDNGDLFVMHHHQDCCEYVYIEDICGDLEDLIDTPILVAEERTESIAETEDDYGEISGWTFYELRTIKGSVTIRWLGSSNGYYGIGVDFDKLKTTDDDDGL